MIIPCTVEQPSQIQQALYEFGRQFAAFQKHAAEAPTISYALNGMLYVTPSNWALLSVPNALVRGLFDALDEPGIELPRKDTDDKDSRLNAHISVIRPEEMEQIGGPDRLTERGKRFSYTLGPLKTVQPAGWNGISKVWFVEVRSPELQQLRKSYGLTPLPHHNEFQFHITCAIRRKNVLWNNSVSK